MNGYYKSLDDIGEPLAKLTERDLDIAAQKQLESLLNESDEQIEAYVQYMMVHAELSQLGDWQTGFGEGAATSDDATRPVVTNASHLETKERELVMSSQQTHTDTRSSIPVAAICLMVLIGGTVALLSLPEMQTGELVVQKPEAPQLSHAEVQTRLTELVDDFNRLNDQQRFREAALIVVKAEQLAPNDPLVDQMKASAKFIRRLQQVASLKERQEAGVFAAWESVDASTIPYDDVTASDTLPSGSVLNDTILSGTDRRIARITSRPQFNTVDAGVTYDTGTGETAVESRGPYWYAPNSGTATGGVRDEDLRRRILHRPVTEQDVREARQKGILNELAEVEATFVPFDDSSPIVYPHRDVWRRISEDREKYVADGAALEKSTEAQIAKALDEDTTFAFNKTPLNEAVGFLKEYHKVEIQLDMKALEDSGIESDTPISRDAKGITLRSGLKLVGRDLDLTFIVKDEVLLLTTPEVAEDHLVARVFPVADLVLPIEVKREFVREILRKGDTNYDRYSRIIENAFKGVVDHPLSTFSIDVDTASYANTRQYLMQSNHLPPADAVRIEELVNYFDYAYAGPKGDDPFASHIEVAACPWQPKHRLVRVALKGKEMDRKERPESNLVFLVDVSGSMNDKNKLPLVKEGLKLLTKELGKNDRVAMVVYAGAAGLVLESTVGYEKETINAAIDKLDAGGSTAGGAGIKLAYQTAVDHFIRGGVNRVILCTDGDFNVGVSNTDELEKMAEDQAKSGVFLSVMGFGRGNLNDAMMERITNKGNGNYAYIDTLNEAKKVFVEQMSGTLVTIAKDVKIQIEFNPAAVAGYRLIGYENRLLAKEDFNDDTKDAGEIGAGHTVTALYEIVPAGEKVPTPDVDKLKYQKPTSLTKEAKSGEMLTLKLRYKQPDGEKSKLLEFPVKDSGKKADAASDDFKFASAVASFSMLLRGSKYVGDADYDSVLKLADAGKGDDAHGYRAEFIDMVKQAKKVDKRP